MTGRDQTEALREALDRNGLCPDCACAKADHGTFGWFGCGRRFPATDDARPTP